ncbi:hypothetical protein DXG01_004174 [Tephrocybe rancida]|nr:hypothetical protein DXG01_004174 [Tephrocybe rancida]
MQSAMQCDAMSVDQEEDQDSLFGSPPSSPVRGRSPSPALALPSASNSTQNVGTIALPGSHHYSELPVTPLALSLSYALTELPQWPPALRSTAIPSNTPTPTSSSRASSAGPSGRPKKKIKKAQSKESTPRPPPPEIPLPDPSGPVPANFLRNQSALLGTAGLVGGVKPAHLSTNRRSRGTVISNPIVIDDEEQPAPPRLSNFRQPYPKQMEIAASLLPTPSTQDVVAMLIGQKDIFPVLESLLRLIAAGGGPQALNPPTPKPLTSFRRTPQSFQPSGSAMPGASTSFSTAGPSSMPPQKKRRLNHVPAGAVDWDVPYPFPEGQGPESYRTTWEHQRGKQLVSQLVTLIKSAARKAATRKYLQNEEAKKQFLASQQAYDRIREAARLKEAEEPKVYGHYRPSTVTYGLQGEAAAAARAQVQAVLTDASNGNKKTTPAIVSTTPSCRPIPPSTSSTSGPQSSTPFDQLISSLLAATPNQNTDLSSRTSSSNNAIIGVDIVEPDSSATSGSPNPEGLDQGLFDNWMNILQTFPMPAQDFSSTHNMWGLPPQSQSDASTSTSTPANDDFGFFDFDQTDPSPVDPGSYDFGSIFGAESTSSTTAIAHTVPSVSPTTQNTTPFFTPQDLAIDPALLAISIPQPSITTPANALETTPSLAGSPMPSLSSLGDIDPSTPNSAIWDQSMPEIFTGFGEASVFENRLVGRVYRREGLAGQGMWGRALRNTFLQAYDFRQGGADDSLNTFSVTTEGKGKGKDTGDSVARPPLLLPTAARSEYGNFSMSSSIPLQISAPSIAILRPADRPQTSKADILRRATERKKQLKAEIETVRTQLWETTIEQGVLSHMNKLCSTT